MFFQSNQDKTGEIDLNTGAFFEKIDSWLDGFVRLLPNLGIAIVTLIIFIFLARFIQRLIKNRAAKNDRSNLGTVLGGFIKWVILITGGLLAATIVVPSLKPGDLIAGLGVSSVAIGFAFKDILQNWLAGLLILLRQPFEIGDQIVVNGFEGSVERIETRATIIKTYNGEQVVVPNSDIYTNAVRVKTANDKIRSQYDIGVGYGDSIEEALEVILKAIEGIDGVDKEKGVEALPWDLAASWVTIRARWWTNSSRAEVVKVKAKVIHQMKLALDEAKIDMPYDTKVHLLHDQTEESDGDRTAQREGWPSTKEGNDPAPRWKKMQTSSNDKQQGNSKNGQKEKTTI